MSKTNIGLVDYCRSKIGTPYVYGAKMELLTLEKYNYLKKLYGSMVWDSDINKVGKVCCDCSGLISAYTGKIRNSTGYKNAAKAVNPISTIAIAPPGVLVWFQGHIGIYSGTKNSVPYYIAEDGSAYGCREVPLSYNKWTHWLECTDIEYIGEDLDVVDTTKIKIDGKTYTVNRIFKENRNYVELQSFTQAGFKIDYDSTAKIPVITSPVKS